MTTSGKGYVGIDVSAATLEVAVLGRKRTWQVSNDGGGIRKLIRRLRAEEPELIVVEATGGYEAGVVRGTFEAGLAVALVSPQRVTQYARARGLLAKTDRLDAQNLAEFGKSVQPRQFVAKSDARRRLSGLLERRKQVEEMLKGEKNRLRTVAEAGAATAGG